MLYYLRVFILTSDTYLLTARWRLKYYKCSMISVFSKSLCRFYNLQIDKYILFLYYFLCLASRVGYVTSKKTSK